MRSDFAPLPVKLEHMDISLNFIDGRVEACNELRIRALKELSEIELDAQDIEVHSVELIGGDGAVNPVAFNYDTEKDSIAVTLPGPMSEGDTFSVRTRSTCVPSDNILDGLYKDTTPEGAPQQYMSQCQQWGFQRIMPIFDDCTAKCTMRTTIEGDARYTHMISNGNICRDTNPDGKPCLKEGDDTRQLITYENPIPMAPYLFIVCVGTWDVLEDEVTYPSGKTVRLEYLVPPGKIEGAKVPMEILRESVLWQNRTQDYEYKHDVYRTICMEKSNFGGMENVGNTTIVTSAALIDEWISDRRLEYAHGVILHEFEHNQCGSEVTMETPFDMWLNEAFTVDVERQFVMSQFDPDRIRLSEVDDMRSPIGGPLAIEDGGHMGNVVREGFNHPDEVVDGVTYVKAAEVIRMLKILLGEEVFKKAKNTYFSRHEGGNANTDDFFNCFEEVSGRDLSQFKKEWLYTIGYPVVEARHSYDSGARKLSVDFSQTRSGQGGLFHVPVIMSAVDGEGKDIPGTDTVVELTEDKKHVEFNDVDEPAFISMNRGCSFYGTFSDESLDADGLVAQVRKDSDMFGRVEAMRRLTDIERIKLIKDPGATVSDEWLGLYHDLLMDKGLSHGIKYYLMRIDEQSLDRSYLPFYRERYAARMRLLDAVSGSYLDDLIGVYEGIDTYHRPESPKDGLDDRMLKAVLLRSIAQADSDRTQKIASDHLRNAWNMSDKVSALSCINLSHHPERSTILEDTFNNWKDHLNAYTSYLIVVSGGTREDVFDMIAAEETRPEFRIQHPSHNRALFMPMTSNNKMLWSEKGLSWLADTVIRLAPVNENSAIHMVACLQQVNNLADDLKPLVLDALRKMDSAVDADRYPSASGRIRAYLGK